MKDELVSIDTAILAKEKGFNEVTDVFFSLLYPKGVININGLTNFDEVTGIREDFVSLPTQSLLQRWLREEKGINVMLSFKLNIKMWDYIVYEMKLSGKEYVMYYKQYYKNNPNRRFNTYEEALEFGLQEALKLI